MLSNIVEEKPKKDKAKIFQTNIFLGIVLVFLIIIVIVISLFNSNDEIVPLIDLKNKVDTIEITKLSETNILVWQVDKWVVANHNNQLAKQDYVVDIFDTLDRLVVSDVVSVNPDKQAVFQVDDSGIQVIMKSGDKIIASFVVGKNGPSWPSSYLRFQEEDEVYLVREVLPQVFGWSEWRNMTIMQLGNDLIQGLKWSNGLEVVKEESEWKSISPKELVIEEIKIKTVLDNLSDLEAVDIVNIKAWELNQGEASFVLEVKTTDNQTYRLSFYYHDIESIDELETSTSFQGDYDYYVVREGSDMVYVLTKYVVENMEKKIEFLEN